MPHVPPFIPRLLVRTLVVWAGLRLGAAIAVKYAVAAGGEPPPVFVLLTAAGVLACSLAAVLVDMRRRGETFFLAHLGIGTARTAAFLALPIVLIEVALAVAAAS